MIEHEILQALDVGEDSDWEFKSAVTTSAGRMK